jgi:hypothetical protein
MKMSLAILVVVLLVMGGCTARGLMGGAMGSAVLFGADTAIGTVAGTVFKSKQDREREKAIMNTLAEQRKAAKKLRSRMSKGLTIGQEKAPTAATKDPQSPQ